jgi:pimeloyl-ACP methyl ester carboxylesterase
VKIVEETVRLEHASSPNKPIYLVGESFGACLALAVAARNPKIDLVLILVNPGEFAVFCSIHTANNFLIQDLWMIT